MPLSHSKYSEMTPEQYELLGRFVVEWSNVEYLLGEVLSHLMIIPGFLGRTYNDQMRALDLDKAIRNILDIHEKRYTHVLVTEALCAQVLELVNMAGDLRSKRNKLAHYLWSRWSDQKVFGTRLTGKLPVRGKENRDSWLMTNEQLQEYGSQAHQLVESFLELLPLLPSKNEDDFIAENMRGD